MNANGGLVVGWIGADGARWQVADSAWHDAAVRIRPDGASPHAFGLPAAREVPFPIGGGRVLRVEDGASVNCDGLHLHPHGDGCHAESVAHVLPADDARALAGRAMLAATPPLLCGLLLDVATEPLGATGERYAGLHDAADRVLARRALERAWQDARAVALDLPVEALLLRVYRPPLAESFDFSGSAAPYPTAEALDLLVGLGARWLIVDLPSIDREDDGGSTPNHRRWWGLDGGDGHALDGPPALRGIVELARFPAALPAGPVAVALGLAPIESDAVPAGLRVARLVRSEAHRP